MQILWQKVTFYFKIAFSYSDISLNCIEDVHLGQAALIINMHLFTPCHIFLIKQDIFPLVRMKLQFKGSRKTSTVWNWQRKCVVHYNLQRTAWCSCFPSFCVYCWKKECVQFVLQLKSINIWGKRICLKINMNYVKCHEISRHLLNHSFI